MAVLGAKSHVIFVATVVSVAFLGGGAIATDAPAPTPTSAAGVPSPLLVVAALASFVTLIVGSLLR